MENIIQEKDTEYIKKTLESVSKNIILPFYGNLSKEHIFKKSTCKTYFKSSKKRKSSLYGFSLRWLDDH